MQAEAVADVEAGTGNAGVLLRTGKYGKLAFVVGENLQHLVFAHAGNTEGIEHFGAVGVKIGLVGRQLFASSAPMPSIVKRVGLGGGQIHAATLVAGAAGFDAPQIGFQIEPRVAFGLPCPAEFVGVGADLGIDALHLRR